MLYNWIIEVEPSPAWTKEAPKEEPMSLAIGIVTWYSVVFPPGCAGLVHCKIYHREHQIVPSKGDDDLSGDTFPIEWTDYYELYERPADFLARCWSDDDTYPHWVTIRIAVVPRRAIVPLAIADALAKLSPVGFVKRVFTGVG